MKDIDKQTGSNNEPISSSSHRSVHQLVEQFSSNEFLQQHSVQMPDSNETDSSPASQDNSSPGSAEGIGAVSTASSVGLSSQGTLAMEDVIAMVGSAGVNVTTTTNNTPPVAILDPFQQCHYAYTNAALELADEPRLAASNRFSSAPNATLNPNPAAPHCRRLTSHSSIVLNCSDSPPIGNSPTGSGFGPANKLCDEEEAEEITWTDFDIRNHRFNARKLVNRLGKNARKHAKHFSFQEQMFTMFPLLDKLRNYNVKQDLIMDIIAGITISILHVPQGIAYSLLIGIPPVYGLYTSFFPVLIYAFLGTSMHISVGTMSVLDMMLSQIVRKYHNMNIDDYMFHNGTLKGNLTMEHPPTELYSFHLGCTEVQLLTTLCILVGLFQIVMGVFQMGAISIILSDQLVSAFSCGAAFHVVVSQLPSVFEIKIPIKRDGPFALFYSMADIVQYVHATKTPAFLLALSVFAVLMIYKEVIDRHVKKHIPIPVPIDLIVIILATVASKYLHLSRDYSVNVMGNIPTGLPEPELPRFDIVNRDVIQDAFILSMISYAAALSLSKIYAKKHHYTVRANQEFFALGVSNFVSSFFFCFPATASLSRASVMGELSRTQLSSLISCSILLQILLFLAPILTDLPKCVVGVIIICAQKSLLAQCEEFPKAWKLSRYEGMIWMVTFLGVICFGIDYGLMLGAVFSVFTIVMRFYHPKLRLLGQIPYTEIYLDIRQHRAAKEVPGIKVIQFTSPLFFINKDMFQESVLKRTLKNQVFKGAPEGFDYGPVRALVLDCSAMSFIDSGGVEAIAEIANELQQRKIQLFLASLSPPVISMLTRMHFFEKTPYTLIFPSVHEAVLKSDSPLLARKLQS